MDAKLVFGEDFSAGPERVVCAGACGGRCAARLLPGGGKAGRRRLTCAAGGHQPGGAGECDASGLGMGLERCFDRGPRLLGGAGVDASHEYLGHVGAAHETQHVIGRAAHRHRPGDLLQRDLREGGVPQDLVHALGVGQRERSGAPGWPRSGIGTYWRAAPAGTMSHSLTRRSRQQVKAIRPPGLRARPMLANAATGSSKNITPKRLTTASKLAGGSG